MKQPELGKRISELRKAKGLTQEELVEKCNISVRTIQRIEAGEVTPRSYTVKTILAALEYDLDKLSDEENSETDSISSIKDFFLIDAEKSSRPKIISHLNEALIFGIIYFGLGFFESAAEYLRVEEERMLIGTWFYIFIKIAVFVAFFFFQRGFILVGGLFKNYLLKISSLLFIFGVGALAMYDIASVFYDAVERKFVLGAFSLTLGGLGIVYGIALIRVKKPLGAVAQAAGILEIIAGGFFISILLFFMGYIVLVPAEIMEIILLYKTLEIIKQHQG